MGVLAVVLVATMATPVLAAPPLLERIELVGNPATAVRLHVSAPTTPRAQALAADGDAPERIYVDLADTRLAAPLAKEIDGTGALLLRVRAAQFDPRTARVVLDLTHRTAFRVVGGERNVTIELGATPPPPQSARRAVPREATPPPAPTAAVETAAAIPPGVRPPASSSMIPSAKVSNEPPAESEPEEDDNEPTAVTTAEPDTPPEPRAEEPAPPVLASAAPSPDAAPPPSAAPRVAEPVGPPAPPPVATSTRAREHAARATRARFPLVVLDAGHGGRDPGAAGVGGVLEKDVVLELTLLVARRLAARLPVDVLMTRTDDSYIPIERRVASENATLFISLHANACTSPSARGLEVFYGGGTLRTASSGGAGDWRAALLGRCIDQALQARIGGVRGHARPAGFVVLARNPAPSALVEIGYLTHPAEGVRAQDRQYHEVLADALVDGIAAFLRASAPPL
jgi:N-acetylmuramoyl-L-alanine amidase